MDASGRVVRDPGNGDPRSVAPDAEPVSLSDLLPESATVDLMAAIRAAADTGNAQFLEFDLLSDDGIRRIHAEAAPDPDHQGEFVVTSREYSGSDTSELIMQSRDVDRFAAYSAEARDLEAVFSEFARVLAVHLTFDQMNIVTVDPERDEQQILFTTDHDLDAAILLSGTAVQVVSRTNEPLVVPTAIPSVIVVPLRSSGTTLAYISVHSKAWESFNDDNLEVVTAFCPSVASAIAADGHRKTSSRSTLEQGTLQAISAISAVAGDLRTMLEVTADRIHRTKRFTFVQIKAFATGVYAASSSDISAVRGLDSLSVEEFPDLEVDRGSRSWSKVIGAISEPLGDISVHPVQATGFDQEDEDFLSECARRLAHGIQRLETEERLRRLQSELDASREIERATAGLSDLGALVEVAAEEIVRLAEPASLVIRVNHPGATELRHEHQVTDELSPNGMPSGHLVGDSIGLPAASVPLISPAGVVGDIQASWNSGEEARTGLRRLEAMTPRFAERVNALLLMERAESGSRDTACLAEIEAAIQRCTEPALALEATVSVLSDRLNGARVSVAALEPDRDSFLELAVAGFPIQEWNVGKARPLHGSLEETLVLSTGSVSSSGNAPDALVARWPSEAIAVGAGVRSLASAVIPTGDDASAWLSARSPQDPGFSDGDVGLLARVATLIAGPVLRRRPVNTGTAPGSDMEILARIGHISQGSTGVEIPYARLTAELASVTRFDQIEVAELTASGDAARRVYLSGKPVPGWEANSEFLLPGTATEAVIRSRTGLMIAGLSDTEMAGRFPSQAAALAADLKALVAAPLVINGEPVGSLVIRSVDLDAYSQRDLAIVEAVAVHLSAAIARGRLQGRIERQRHEAEALATIGSSWDLEPEVVAERAAVAFKRLVRCDAFVVTAVSADADTVRVVASHGVDEADRDFFADRMDRLRSKSDTLLPGGRADYASSLRSRIGPMSRPLGYVHAFSSTPNAFTQDDADLLQRVAEHLGSVFERVRATDHSTRLSAEQGLRRKLDSQNRELKELTISRDRFLRTVVHELHSPLMSVQLITDLLMQNATENLGEEQLAQLGLIADSGERLKALVENLLDVSQIQSETFVLTREEFDASPMIRDLCQTFGGILAVNGQRIELALDRPDEPLWLNADPERFSSLLSNLIGNACKYSDNGTPIRIHVDRRETQVHVSVIDQGEGISDEDLGRLFSPFERGTNAKTLKLPGTGLGLVIARSIARLHGGDLVLESHLGEGTTARFHIEGAQDGPSEAYRATEAANARGLSPE